MILGITGGIASGKSLITQYFREAGYPVIDADKVARQVVEPGSPGLKEIEEVFGSSYIHEDGSYNRKKMGDLVFNDEGARQLLNQILHPIIRQEMQNQIQSFEEAGFDLIVVDVPLLYEAGFDALVDQVLVVAVEEDVQLKRLMERDQLTQEEAQKKIDSQWPLQDIIPLADVVIDNNGTKEESLKQVQSWIEEKFNS